MIHEEALHFLRVNQPLPTDELLDVGSFNEVREYFIENPDPKCVPLFLNCFGEGSGFGLYQRISDLLVQYDESLVIFHLKCALFSHFSGVRYWCAQICEGYESSELVDGLIYVYENGDIDSKCASLTALSTYKDPRVFALAKQAFNQEKDVDVLEIATDILQD